MSAIEPGVYQIQNVATGTVMELLGGSSVDVTNIVGHAKRPLDDIDVPFQLWVVSKIGNTDAFLIENTRSGTVMDLTGSAATDGTPIIGFHKKSEGTNQNWIIKRTTDDKAFVIQCEATKTFATLHNGFIQGFAGTGPTTTNANQHWAFVRV